MKNLFKILLITCSLATVSTMAWAANRFDFEKSYNQLVPAAKWSYQWRAKSKNFYNELKSSGQIGERKNKPLTKMQLHRIYETVALYSETRGQLYNLAFLSYPLFKNLNTSKEIKPQTFNVQYPDGRDNLSRLKISLAAGLILYDNYAIGIAPYESNQNFRLLLMTDAKSGKLIQDTILSYNSKQYANYLKMAIDTYKANLTSETNPRLKALDEVIQSSFTFRRVSAGGILKTQSELSLAILKMKDSMAVRKKSFEYTLSQIFGNSIGSVSTRYGYMVANPSNNSVMLPEGLIQEKANELQSTLQPMDVLLEKTVFRLTDMAIPGHFGHVAIYVGTQKQIIETFGQSFWESLKNIKNSKGQNIGPKIMQMIQSGHTIVEALRPGVQINTMEHFLNIDDFLSLRPTKMNLQQKKEALILALQQIGKDYDFNFDVETDKTIVCSEIVYVSFISPQFQWRTSQQMGRFTISPDNVLQTALDTKQFVPIQYYSMGVKIEKSTAGLVQLLKQFTAGDYRQATQIHGVNPY